MNRPPRCAWAALAVAGAGLVATGCTGGATSPPGAGSTTSSTPVPTTTSVPASVHCAATGLSGSVEGTQPRPGSIEVTLQLRNIGTAGCNIEGYPGLQLLDSAGTELHTSVIRGGSSSFTALVPASVTVAPQASAYVNVGFSAVPSGRGPCESAASLWLTPPGDVGHVTVSEPATVCGGALTVSPFFGAGSLGTETTAPPS